ncbi:MAG: exopolysaccharide biosynthesis protein [Acetobacteraceae bacterium]|nr:exopolysaccharide biosynthesis protein [Acetobacteraceae bacterium]MCX7685528.1 exopolysaccharide biosynthesis protein [Acetobacteraceae bacterium]MDW8398436.1 exopolysaccharide biosynthesis protein [Acetobacteraceae bacterium]
MDATPTQPVPHFNGEAPISRIVRAVAERLPGERLAFGEIAEALGDRAFGILILLFCLPALVPGLATVFSVPLMLIGVQMGIGMRRPWFPAVLARQSIRREDLLKMADASASWLSRVERFVKPRPGFFTGPVGDRIVGWLTAYAALMILLPGPMTNFPPMAGTVVMALGVVENDSRVVGIGVVLAFLGNLFATGVLLLLGWAALQALLWVL